MPNYLIMGCNFESNLIYLLIHSFNPPITADNFMIEYSIFYILDLTKRIESISLYVIVHHTQICFIIIETLLL